MTSLVACGEEDPGRLTLSIQSDMKIPEDVDALYLYVFSATGAKRYAQRFDVGPGSEFRIPTTIALTPIKDGLNPITVRVLSEQRGTYRTLSESVLSVPAGRNPHLRIPIQWLCDGEVETAAQPDQVTTSCMPGQTCVLGSCVTSEIDVDALPDYDPKKVYGGGETADEGSCFDTLRCFSAAEGARGVAPESDGSDCTITAPVAAGALNLAMMLPAGGDGICGTDTCLIPLDEDQGLFPYPVGWWRDADDARLVHLPPGVCDKFDGDEIQAVALSTACATKTAETPTCGPWSSVEGEYTSDAPAPPLDDPEEGCERPQNPDESTLCLQLQPEVIDPFLTASDDLDGVGSLRVEVFDGPDARTAMRVGLHEVERIEVTQLPETLLTFTGLRGDVYVRAMFFDNPTETSLDTLRRGGAFVGVSGREHVGDPDVLDPLSLQPGEALNTGLAMQAARRLAVTVRLEDGVSPLDGGDGVVSWQAYPQAAVASGEQPVGTSGPSECLDLSAGPAIVEGHVFWAGDIHLVATLDDFQVATAPVFEPGSLAGSIVSAAPEATDGFQATGLARLENEAYAGQATVSLGYVVEAGTPAPAEASCGGGSCSNGALDLMETDVDCGGPCPKCATGLGCAGDGDCQSFACEARICQEPRCDDGRQNASETDTDCGGDSCGPCEAGERCLRGSDCAGGTCTGLTCQ